LRAEFDQQHGADGIERTYVHAFVAFDPTITKALGPAEIAAAREDVRRAALEAARAHASAVAEGRTPLEALIGRGARQSSLDEARSRASRDAPDVAALAAGVPAVVPGDSGVFVVVVDRRLAPCRFEAVKLTVLPRPGEAAGALAERTTAEA